jgi:branched-chain amino acid transport system substrate-binding protein
MDRRRRLQLVSLLCLMLLMAAACGQKGGVSQLAEGFSTGGGGTLQLPEGTHYDENGNVVDDKTGEVIATADEVAAANPGVDTSGGSSTNTDANGNPTTASGDPNDPNSSSNDPDGGGDANDPNGGGNDPNGKPGTGGDASGVTKDTITIGIHAPITGAAPVPSSSFEKGKDLYWKYLQDHGIDINGRHVEVVFRNDKYNPSDAVFACREMVEEEHVFLLIGVAGADQIQACARYAASVGVPYLSGGVTELGVNSAGYFPLWMSYAQQGPLLADYLVTKAGAKGEKNGMIYTDSATFQDAHSSFVNAMRSKGATVEYDRPIPKGAGVSDAQTYATELQTRGIQNVYVLTSPTFFIQLANAAQSKGYHPHWVGVGLSMALDTVAKVACANNKSIDGAHFLNPYPAYVDSDKFDPTFRKAGGTDDIMFGLWTVSKVVEKMLRASGPDLTREKFDYATERSNIVTNVAPPLKYSPSNHFGGQSMHLNTADCANSRWRTEQSFVSNF